MYTKCEGFFLCTHRGSAAGWLGKQCTVPTTTQQKLTVDNEGQADVCMLVEAKVEANSTVEVPVHILWTGSHRKTQSTCN